VTTKSVEAKRKFKKNPTAGELKRSKNREGVPREKFPGASSLSIRENRVLGMGEGNSTK